MEDPTKCQIEIGDEKHCKRPLFCRARGSVYSWQLRAATSMRVEDEQHRYCKCLSRYVFSPDKPAGAMLIAASAWCFGVTVGNGLNNQKPPLAAFMLPHSPTRVFGDAARDNASWCLFTAPATHKAALSSGAST